MAGTIFPGILPPDAAEQFGLGDDATAADVAEIIDDGICPWCDDEYQNVPAHASAAHPDDWDAYAEQRED